MARTTWWTMGWTAVFVVLVAATGQAQIQFDFNGAYTLGIHENWIAERDGWGNPVEPSEVTPGHGGFGSGQGLATTNGNHFVFSTIQGLAAGNEYEVGIWIRTLQFDGTTGTPEGWVEFGWDPQARNTTQPPPTADNFFTWCVDPKLDFANNVGAWTQYKGEPFVATGPTVTIAFKVGSVHTTGIQAHFDNLTIQSLAGPGGDATLPDDFNTSFTLGAAEGWSKRFISGGDSPRWEEAAGRTGSAQRLFAGPEGSRLAANIGVAKRFEATPDEPLGLSVWIYGSDSNGDALTDPNSDPGPVIKIGVDVSGQDGDPAAASIRWSAGPTTYFSTPGNQNTWRQFSFPVVVPQGDAVSVWLWAEGDDDVGVDARFDDLVREEVDLVPTNAGAWQLYQ